ncbi:nuclear transport factor 2 family protein [Paracoccus yeei]|uniref:Nuclear transport factor 2 family protein n=1 Tax=Paracoccus yeei TaxID=147645 RepID=A0A5P2QVT6_9RHOB|nr:nuclear transport factor 2 family protein [Paracoccus yeei]QEU09476.1 nuclear transport factor 2 family protein [Paracoccus yeei]
MTGAPVDLLLAESALRRLATTYSRAIDRRDFVLLRSLYDDAGQDTHGHAFSGSADAYIDFVQQALSHYRLTTHYVVDALFAVDGDRAEGEVHKINHHITHDGQEVVTGSRSLDRYIRRDGVWRFLSRRVVLDWSRQQPLTETQDPAADSPCGTAGPDDPTYTLPLLPPFGAIWRG